MIGAKKVLKNNHLFSNLALNTFTSISLFKKKVSANIGEYFIVPIPIP